VGTLDLDGDKRYIIAPLDQKTLGITVRVNWSLTPDLSIQFYGQPFISSGYYAQFKYATNARDDEYFDRFHQLQQEEISFDQNSNPYLVQEKGQEGLNYNVTNPNFNF